MALTKVQKEGIETLINNNADNRVITGSSSANTLNGESELTYDGSGHLNMASTNDNSKITLKRTGTSIGGFVKVRNESNDNGLTYVATDGNSGKPNHVFFTDASSNSDTPVERMRINSDGTVAIGPNTDGHALLTLSQSASAHLNALAIQQGNTGSSSGDGLFIGIDSNADAFIFHKENRSIEFGTANTERMRIDSSGNVGIGTTPNKPLHIFRASNDAEIRLQTNSGTERNSYISLRESSGDLDFYTVTASNMKFHTSNTERMRIRSNGNVMIGNSAHFTANVAKLDVVHAGNNTAPTYVSRFFQETNDLGSDHACIQLRHGAASGTQDATMIDFKNSGGHTHGSIKMDGSSVSFNSTSDYRIKENLVSLSNAITRLKTLKAYRFNFKDNPTKTVDGFLAHEVTAVPEAITGTKDEVDSNNNPVYQGIDQSKLVPLLTAALQEEISKREALETRVAALEAA